MVRSLYILLLRLHPLLFRERFGEEMITVFDETARTSSGVPLLVDAALSVWRQRVLRPDRRRMTVTAAAAPAGDVLMFQVLDASPPRRSALVNGALLSILFFVAVTSSLGHSRSFPRLLIGTRHPRPQVLGVDRASVREAQPTTEVTQQARPVDPLREFAAVYFKAIRVLGALDADGDLVISEGEMALSPKTLQKLDLDGDGKLSAEECGFFLGSGPAQDHDFVARAIRDFMRLNPVLAALNADHDGEISENEILQGPRALRRLDRNRDGFLTAVEVMPDLAMQQAAGIMSRLDRNHDGYVTQDECRQDPLAEMLDRADRNHDGVATEEELAAEIRLQYELKRLEHSVAK